MEQYTEAFVGIDTAKNKHALAIADLGREGEVRYLGEIDSAPAAVERMVRKLAGRYGKLYFCYEAGPTGYGLYRQVRALGHEPVACHGSNESNRSLARPLPARAPELSRAGYSGALLIG